MTGTRTDGRRDDELRPVRITPGYLRFPEGSVLIEMGLTQVICAATVERGVPRFREGAGGWVTAEYAMLPRSTHTRTPRPRAPRATDGRTYEIQRLIGRSLRMAVDLTALGEHTITLDCDVVQADAGTRTAAVTGSYVALVLALRKMQSDGIISSWPVKTAVAAVSAGVLDGRILLDLSYEEDCRAEADFNVVMTSEGEFIEVQGTAEGAAFDRARLDAVLALAEKGIRELQAIQARVLGQC